MLWFNFALSSKHSSGPWFPLCSLHELLTSIRSVIWQLLALPSVSSKRGHETKKHVLLGCQTWRVLPPNIWSLTAIKANCLAKGELFICFWSASSAHISFFSTFRHISLRNSTCLHKLFLTSKNSCKEYFVERKQIKSTTAAYSKLHMFGGKTCPVCTQLEHVFSSHVHA